MNEAACGQAKRPLYWPATGACPWPGPVGEGGFYNGGMFVHLRLHTEFSVVDGTTRIDQLAKAAIADRQPAMAITDLNNLFGAIKFYKENRGKGVKPVLGAEIYLEDPAAAGFASLRSSFSFAFSFACSIVIQVSDVVALH